MSRGPGRSVAPKAPVGAWAERAACRGMDPALFFPEHNVPIPQEAYDACAECPVAAECLDYALTPPIERWGLWGRLGVRARSDYLKAKQRGQQSLLDGAA